MKIDLYLPEKLNRKLIIKISRLCELEALATSTGGLMKDGPKVKAAPRSEGGFENIIIKKAELEKNITSLRVRKDAAEKDIEEILRKLPDSQAHLLYQRHIALMSILGIAEYYGRSYRTIQRWLKGARRAFNDAASEI